jgi:hypothetical protein
MVVKTDAILEDRTGNNKLSGFKYSPEYLHIKWMKHIMKTFTMSGVTELI